MISVEEAKKIISQTIPEGPPACIPLQKAVGRVLAKNIVSPMDTPPFTSSAMDGYAIFHNDTPGCLKVVACIAAGDIPKQPLQRGEAVRIMTGAMVPVNATAVVPQEEVTKRGENEIFVSRKTRPGEHIRRQGEEFKKGDVALSKGAPLTPGGIGMIASLGIHEVSVFAPPRISILSTGSELIFDAGEMKPGKIFESNSFSLQAALQDLHIETKRTPPIADTKEALQKSLRTAAKENDFVFISGGVSVGSFDFVKEVLAEMEVETLFWGVAQKPGKPLFFGKKEHQFFFGLPGNPASTLVCYYEYLRPAILKWMGHEKWDPFSERGRLMENFSKKSGRLHFVRAMAQRNEKELSVYPLSGQESHRMSSFAAANCLMIVPKEVESLKSGEEVTIHWI